MADSEVRPEFMKGINEVKQLVSDQVSLKQVNGNLIDGNCLVSLAEAYSKGINTNGVPVLQTAWNYMCENQSSKVIGKLVDQYKD